MTNVHWLPRLAEAARPTDGSAEQKLTLAAHLEGVADPDCNVAEAAIAHIEVARARRRVRRLPLLERKVIIWRYGLLGEQLSCREVGERLGMSKASAVAIEQRALHRLRGMYAETPEAA